MSSTHAETSRTRYQHNDEASYYISEVDLQKLPYMDQFVCHWFVLHSKILFNALKNSAYSFYTLYDFLPNCFTYIFVLPFV